MIRNKSGGIGKKRNPVMVMYRKEGSTRKGERERTISRKEGGQGSRMRSLGMKRS